MIDFKKLGDVEIEKRIELSKMIIIQAKTELMRRKCSGLLLCEETIPNDLSMEQLNVLQLFIIFIRIDRPFRRKPYPKRIADELGKDSNSVRVQIRHLIHKDYLGSSEQNPRAILYGEDGQGIEIDRSEAIKYENQFMVQYLDPQTKTLYPTQKALNLFNEDFYKKYPSIG